MTPPSLWIIAGPNGAGKTTCVQKEPISLLLPQITFLNPDDRTLAKLKAIGHQGFCDAPMDVQTRLFLESANEVYDDLEAHLCENKAIGIETVLSSRKYMPLVESVLARGGFVRLIYVALSSPAIAIERVDARVKRGGHGIPHDKIEKRWQRSLDNLAWFAAAATAFWIADNSDSNQANPPKVVAHGTFGKMMFCDDFAFPELRAALAPLSRK